MVEEKTLKSIVIILTIMQPAIRMKKTAAEACEDEEREPNDFKRNSYQGRCRSRAWYLSHEYDDADGNDDEHAERDYKSDG